MNRGTLGAVILLIPFTLWAQTVNYFSPGGDLTGTWSSQTIAAGAVTLAKQANHAANSIQCNNTGSPATAVDCTVAQVNTLLGLSTVLTGTTGSIGGGALVAGQCASGTVTVTGATTAMAIAVTPVTYPGDGSDWKAYVSSSNTITVKVCAIVALTPTASTYNVRVIQ